jgi:hypothetical protein
VLPLGYVVSASRIADRRIILAGYRLADVLTQLSEASETWIGVALTPAFVAHGVNRDFTL